MSQILIENVGKIFSGAGAAKAVDGVTLRINLPQLVTIVGPSGSGKTTLLRLIAGLDQPTSGKIVLDGIDVTSLPSRQRNVAMVFQSSALWPHLSIRNNLLYGARIRSRLTRPQRWMARIFGRTSAMQIRQREIDLNESILRYTEMLGIDHLLDRMPDQLSGGESQRVAITRALLTQPKLLLMDEPFASLDAPLRLELRAQFRALQSSLAIPTLFVTHDQQEALELGERVAVLKSGRLVQFDSPQTLLSQPSDPFVHTFFLNAGRAGQARG